MNRLDIIKVSIEYERKMWDVWDKYDGILTEQVMSDFASVADEALSEVREFTEEQRNIYFDAEYRTFEDEEEVARFAEDLYVMYPDVKAKIREKYGEDIDFGSMSDTVRAQIPELVETLG